MGLRADNKDKVKSITILDDSIMIHMDNDVKSTFVFDRNTEDTPDRAWVDNIIACAESLIGNSRDEKVRSRKYMSKLYANERHYEWVNSIDKSTPDLYNDHEDFIDEVEKHNNKSSDGGDYGDVGDEYDH